MHRFGERSSGLAGRRYNEALARTIQLQHTTMLLTLLALPLALLAAASPVAAPDDSALAPRQDWGLGAPAYSSVLQPGDGETATTDRTKCIGVANATAGAYLTLWV